MTGFDLLKNFNHNLESQIRRNTRQKTIHGQRFPSYEFGTSSFAPPPPDMAEKTIQEFSIPSSDNIPTGPEVAIGESFELKPRVIHMVQAIPFCRLASEDANNHLQQFLEICIMFTIKGATPDAIRLRLFLFSLVRKAKQWFYLNKAELTTWNACSNAFLVKYFTLGKTSALRNQISSFQ